MALRNVDILLQHCTEPQPGGPRICNLTFIQTSLLYTFPVLIK